MYYISYKNYKSSSKPSSPLIDWDREVISLDLRNQTITLGELLDNPQSYALLQRRFSSLLSHPLLAMARHLTLKELIAKSGGHLSYDQVQATLKELEAL